MVDDLTVSWLALFSCSMIDGGWLDCFLTDIVWLQRDGGWFVSWLVLFGCSVIVDDLAPVVWLALFGCSVIVDDLAPVVWLALFGCSVIVDDLAPVVWLALFGCSVIVDDLAPVVWLALFGCSVMVDDFLALRNAAGDEDWRLKESLKLGDLVQRRLEYLQVGICGPGGGGGVNSWTEQDCWLPGSSRRWLGAYEPMGWNVGVSELSASSLPYCVWII